MTKRNLVMVRAGENSLHHRWMDRPYRDRNFDVVLSFYSTDAHTRFVPGEGVTAVHVEGGKWDGLYKTLSALDLDAYDRIWLPDDDIDTCTDTINAMFSLCESYGLAVAQPALSRDSYFSHFIFNRCTSFRLRYTNYVEIMVPCLTIDVLKRALPYFENTMSGFGLDYIWCRWPEAGAFRVAILDAIEVRHTRPVGKILKSAMAAQGAVRAEEEEAQLKERFNLTGRTVPVAFAGVRMDGQHVVGRLSMMWHMTRDWLGERQDFRDPREAGWGILKIARRQLTKEIDLRYFVREETEF
jgi:hypothetical protein